MVCGENVGLRGWRRAAGEGRELGEGAACLGGEKRSEEEKPRVKFRWDGEAEGTARAARRP